MAEKLRPRISDGPTKPHKGNDASQIDLASPQAGHEPQPNTAHDEELGETAMVLREYSSQAILSIGPDGKILVINSIAEEMFGYSRDELLGQNIEMLMPESQRQSHVAQRSIYFASPKDRPMARGLELKGLRKDGKEFPIRVSLAHISSKEGTRAIAFVTDLTERRRAIEALRQIQARLTLASHVLGLGLWDLDVRTGEVHGTVQWGALYGRPSVRAATKDQWLREWVHPDDRQIVREKLEKAIRDNESYEVDFRVLWPDGSVHWLSRRGEIELGPEGKPVRIHGISVDLTERKLAEQESLTFSSKLAAARDAERERIARDLHDELIQDLAALAMDLGTCVLKPPSTPLDLKKVLRAFQMRVIQASESARRAAYELHPSELDDLGIEAALRFYYSDLRHRHQVEIDFQTSGVPSNLDRTIAACIYRVGQESVRNAIAHGSARRITVRLDCTEECIELRVKDDGKGFQLSSLRIAPGLGIAGMRERVSLLNGKFSIHSEPGKGSQVHVEVPLVRGASCENPPTPADEKIGATTSN